MNADNPYAGYRWYGWIAAIGSSCYHDGNGVNVSSNDGKLYVNNGNPDDDNENGGSRPEVWLLHEFDPAAHFLRNPNKLFFQEKIRFVLDNL